MRRFFHTLFAALFLIGAVTSCSQEDMAGNGLSGNEAEVTFDLSMEGQVASRDIGDGQTVDMVHMAVYAAELKDDGTFTVNRDSEIEALKGKEAVDNKGALVKVRLIKGQYYAFVFWAQNEAGNHYDLTNMDAIKVKDYTNDANDETRDAFYAYVKPFKVTGSFKKDVTLKRPFAQLNLGTTAQDIEWAKRAGVEIDQTKVSITGAVYNVLNTITGEATEAATVDFTLADIPDATKEELVIKDTENQFKQTNYEYLASDYLLANEKSEMATLITYKLYDGSKLINTLTIDNAPLQRNWRTNIVGEILTGEGTFNIFIDHIFDSDRNYPMDGSDLNIWDNTVSTSLTQNANGEYEINSAADLAYIWSQPASTWDNATFVLNKDLSFKNVEATARSDKKGDTTPNTIEPLFGEGNGASSVTFKGNNHVIRDFVIDGDNNLNSLFGGMVGGSISNLTIINANVEGQVTADGRAAIVVAQTFGTVKLANVTVKDSKLSGVQKIGGLIGFVNEGQVEVSNCTVDGLTLNSIEYVNTKGELETGATGGLIGYINKDGDNKITNSYVKNSTFNLIQGVKEDKRANGEFIGVIAGTSKTTITNCGVDNNVYTNSISDWTPFHPEFVGGHRDGKATLIVNGQKYPEEVPDFVDKGDYLEVYTAAGLQEWGNRVNAGNISLGLTLMRNIDMPAVTMDGEGKPIEGNWTPICTGITELEQGYKGKIEGNNKTISGLVVIHDDSYTGFVGFMYDGASITNLNLEEAYIKGTDCTGAICGRSQNGNVIENVHVIKSTIIGTDNVGGIAGLNYRRWIGSGGDLFYEKMAYIRNCTIDSESSVLGNNRVGGICGKNYGAVINHCVNYADVTGNTYVGGITGRFRTYGNDASGFIIACGTTDSAIIKATDNAGGITGYILRNDEHKNCASYIVACYSTSKIEGKYKGAIVSHVAEDADDPIASWVLINGASQYKYSSSNVPTPQTCILVEKESDFSANVIEVMNAAIEDFNNMKPENMQCSYKWSWTSGSWPVLIANE